MKSPSHTQSALRHGLAIRCEMACLQQLSGNPTERKRRVSEVRGVADCSTCVSAHWLFEDGRPEEAVSAPPDESGGTDPGKSARGSIWKP